MATSRQLLPPSCVTTTRIASSTRMSPFDSIHASLLLVRISVGAPRMRGCAGMGCHAYALGLSTSREFGPVHWPGCPAGHICPIAHTLLPLGSNATISCPTFSSVHVLPPSCVEKTLGPKAHPSVVVKKRMWSTCLVVLFVST